MAVDDPYSPTTMQEGRSTVDQKLAQTNPNGSTVGQSGGMNFNPANMGQTANQIAGAAGFTGEPNVLHGYEQLSYSWQFYVGPDLARSSIGAGGFMAAESQNSAKEGSKVVIAETGITGFNIQEVIMDSKIAPNFLTRNMGAQKFTIKILEPYGCTLPDKMLLAAKKLKVRNYMKAPWHLKLYFMGYEPEQGRPITFIGDRSWTWKILITKLSTDLTSTGSLHTIEAVGFNDLGHFDQFSIVDSPINIDVKDKQGTIGEIMQDLAQEINRRVSKSYNGKQMYTIKIEDRPYQSNQGGVSKPFDHKITRDEKHKDSSRNQSRVQVSKGTDISVLFDYLISASETGVALANVSAQSGSGGAESLNGGKKPNSIVHRVETKVDLLEWEPTYRDYKRQITYIIKPYDVVRLAVSDPQLDDAEQDGINQQKFSYVNQKLYLRKEYDYLFTGKNTEVVNLDISLNFTFTLASNFYQGYLFYELGSPGRELDEEKRKRLKGNSAWEQLQSSSDNDPNAGARDIINRGNFTPGNYYAEDLEIEKFTALPYSFTQDGNDPRYQVQPSVESNNNRSRSIYGMILNQLYGSYDANLAKISLEIRGDPYWIGQDNTTDSTEEPSTPSKPNFSNGEHMFILRFKLPQGIDEETGDPILSDSDMYSGFYATTEVTHQFINGTFKQTLHAVRIPGMELSKVFKRA